jgi:hypothetical protein
MYISYSQRNLYCISFFGTAFRKNWTNLTQSDLRNFFLYIILIHKKRPQLIEDQPISVRRNLENIRLLIVYLQKLFSLALQSPENEIVFCSPAYLASHQKSLEMIYLQPNSMVHIYCSPYLAMCSWCIVVWLCYRLKPNIPRSLDLPRFPTRTIPLYLKNKI